MSELAFFPTPYPDEDFRSVVYRYHVLSGNRDMLTTNLELFDVKTEKNPHMPRNLTALFSKLPLGHRLSFDVFLYHHTLWPLVRPILSTMQIDATMQELKHGVSGARNFAIRQLGGHQDRVISAELRYCPQCLQEDYEAYGQCLLHRSHQIHDINICVVHHVSLISRCPNCKVELSKRHGVSMLVTPNCNCCGHYISSIAQSSDMEIERQLRLYDDFRVIMDYSTRVDKNEVRQRIEIGLFLKGYTHLSGIVNKSKIIQDITTELSCLTEDQSKRITSKLRKLLYFNHGIPDLSTTVFIMKFLSGSVKNFLTASLSASVPLPFGPGPWTCVNRVCPDYAKGVVEICTRKIIHGNTVSGSFTCPTCGCTYHKRYFFGTSNADTRPTISTMGSLWENKLIELAAQGHGTVEIAREMKTQSVHVAKALQRQNAYTQFNEAATQQQHAVNEIVSSLTEAAATRDSDYEKQSKYRQAVLELVQSNSNLKRTDISGLLPGAYSWLRKRDREWLETILPKRQFGAAPKDWSSVDVALAGKVKEVAEKLYALNPPKRIARSAIINACPQPERSQLIQGPSKVPLSWSVLLENEEHKDDYLIRHTPALVRQLIRSGYTNVTLNSILAFRRSYRRCDDRVRNAIARILGEMGFQDVERGMERYTK